jgi:hypothetical protein
MMQSTRHLAKSTIQTKKKRHISQSFRREELIRAGVCVSCLIFPASDGIHCATCQRGPVVEDAQAFAGFTAD